MSTHGIRTALFCAAAALALACGRAPVELTWSGTVEFPDVQIGSLVGGRVLEVLRAEGDAVAAGEVILRLDPAEWQSALDEATALAEAGAKELALLEAGPRPEEIAQARAEAKRLELLWNVMAQGSRPEEVEGAREELKAAEAKAVEAEREVKRVEDLVARTVEPPAARDRAVAERDAALARRSAAAQRLLLLERGLRPEEIEAGRQAWLAQVERLNALEAGARPEEILAKRATIEAARARIRAAEKRLAELTIAAPADAFLQTLDVRPGDLLKPGEPVAVLLLTEQPWIVVYVPEGDLARVSPGQAADVFPDGGGSLPGRVTWISRRAEYTPRNVQTRGERVTQVFAVKVTIAGDASRLKDGMWADVALR